ncbi:MAG: CHASE2 domain-containing protein [Symploca sp. SIO2B6]|nr:CHASE2 domain-containing protein [Symploca sp. SIO2B6]
MATKLWTTIKQRVKLWREVILPGALIVGIVILVRCTGVLQVQEWMAFDYFLQLRPSEAVDQRIVIVGINEDDLKNMGGFPIPDRYLARMLNILHEYQPRVIGLDLFKDLQNSPGRDLLAQALKDIPNIIGIEVVLNSEDTLNIKPPPELPPERVGFADFIVDPDGKMRRYLLASRTWPKETSPGELKYSLALRLAQAYLAAEDISFEHGSIELDSNSIHTQAATKNPKSTDPIKFAQTTLPRFLPNAGGYVEADANGNQILLNFRVHSKPCQVLSLIDIVERKFNPNLIRDRIIIIGMTAASVKDRVSTAAVKSTIFSQKQRNSSNHYQLIDGVEVHAHATSQIISAVLDQRPLLRVWTEPWEYLWIILWGLLGIALGIVFPSPWKSLLSIVIASLILTIIGYFLIIVGWWIPFVPTLLALCGAGLTTLFFDRNLRFDFEQRSLTIERTFEAVHNGPLQHLAVILRSTEENKLSSEQLRSQLQCLNQELRSIYKSMKQEVLTQSEGFYLDDHLTLDIETSISELLYQVYDNTLERDFPCLATIKTYIPPNFAPLEKSHFTLDQKWGLCLFLQEALCNVGKHGRGATRLDVICSQEAGWYSIRIIDNGVGLGNSSNSIAGNQGTKQAQELAKKLKGKFQRYLNYPQGTICELSWPISGRWRLKLNKWLRVFSKLNFKILKV